MSDSTYSSVDLICPHCDYHHEDMWESGLEDGAEEDWECERCGKTFVATKSIYITYEGRIK